MTGYWDALPENMRSKIERTDSCWNWVGATNSRGYGSLTNGHGGTMLAHRRSYEATRGAIPAGLTIDHLCMNKVCVNPVHLEAVTGAENTRRAAAALTHCKHGHPLAGDNLRIKTLKDGAQRRCCKTCAVRHAREYRLRSQARTERAA